MKCPWLWLENMNCSSTIISVTPVIYCHVCHSGALDSGQICYLEWSAFQWGNAFPSLWRTDILYNIEMVHWSEFIKDFISTARMLVSLVITSSRTSLASNMTSLWLSLVLLIFWSRHGYVAISLLKPTSTCISGR